MSDQKIVAHGIRIDLVEASIMDAERTIAAIDQGASKALKRFAESRVTLDDQRHYLNRMWNSRTDKLYLIESLDGRLVGSVGLHEIDWDGGVARVGAMIFRPEDRGRGFATEALRCLHLVAFFTLGLHRLEANVIQGNVRNIKRFVDLGYRREGVRRQAYLRDGMRHDMVLLSLLPTDWQGS